VRFVTETQSLMVHGRFKDFIALLPETRFARIHKSYVVSLSKVVYLEGNSVKLGDVKLPVSLSFKEAFIAKLHS